jgi:hypothetical protein
LISSALIESVGKGIDGASLIIASNNIIIDGFSIIEKRRGEKKRKIIMGITQNKK